MEDLVDSILNDRSRQLSDILRDNLGEVYGRSDDEEEKLSDIEGPLKLVRVPDSLEETVAPPRPPIASFKTREIFRLKKELVMATMKNHVMNADLALKISRTKSMECEMEYEKRRVSTYENLLDKVVDLAEVIDLVEDTDSSIDSNEMEVFLVAGTNDTMDIDGGYKIDNVDNAIAKSIEEDAQLNDNSEKRPALNARTVSDIFRGMAELSSPVSTKPAVELSSPVSAKPAVDHRASIIITDLEKKYLEKKAIVHSRASPECEVDVDLDDPSSSSMDAMSKDSNSRTNSDFIDSYEDFLAKMPRWQMPDLEPDDFSIIETPDCSIIKKLSGKFGKGSSTSKSEISTGSPIVKEGFVTLMRPNSTLQAKLVFRQIGPESFELQIWDGDKLLKTIVEISMLTTWHMPSPKEVGMSVKDLKYANILSVESGDGVRFFFASAWENLLEWKFTLSRMSF